MRRTSSFLLAALLALPAGAAVVRLPAGAAASVAPAAALGSLLATSLPALPALVSAAPAPAPAIWDASRSQALLPRLTAAPLAAAASPAASAPGPLQTIAAVNSTLRDFTPAQIRGMPAETLSALASVIMDGAHGREPAADLTAASALSAASLAKVESLRGHVQETLDNPGHNESHGDMISARGVPETVKRFDAAGVVFRHYTTKEGLDAILRGKSLWNGFLPYVHLAPGVFRKTYRDLTGVFLTVPQVKGDRVGVPASEFSHYVDVLVPAGLPVLEIEKGAIYLIPLPGRTRGWVADLYRRWASGGGENPTYRRAVADVDADGGPGPALAVPVKIVGSGRVGR